MNKKKLIKNTLIAGLFFLSLGGWLLHLRIHPVAKNPANLIPFISGFLSVFCVPLFFCFRPTIALAYILNGFLVIFGTITMAHFSLAHFPNPVTISDIILTSTFADIAILWAKFALGKALFSLETLKSGTDPVPKGRYFRFPFMGWWLVHLLGMTIIYSLGKIIWK